MAHADQFKVPVEKLRRICNCDQELDYCLTSLDLPPLEGVIGQERAVRSMKFGLAMDTPGYNIFVAGPPGTGKSTYVHAVVSQAAAKKSIPPDWCYINDFSDHDSPLAVSLPAGQGRIFQSDMDELIADLRVAIPKEFEGSDYEQHKDEIVQSVQEKMQERFQAVEKKALQSSFHVKQSPGKFVFVPLKEDKPLSSEEFEQLPAEERKDIEERGHRLEKLLEETIRDGKLLEKQAKGQIDELEKQIALTAAGPFISKLKEKYQSTPKIVEYLEFVQKDIEKNLEIFKNAGAAPARQALPFLPQPDEEDNFTRYKVNLFVSNEKTEGAPVIIETFPNYYNLFGKIEYKNQMMSLTTDFTMVKAGAIHRANGGYLILQVKDVLIEPFVWEPLKRALKYRQAIVENIGEQYRYVPTATLKQEPIPLNVKIILIGSPLYYLLLTQDEDFQKLFKVKVDFDIEMPRTPENICQYVSFVSSLCRRSNLKHFNRAGLAKIIEYGSRLAGHQNKLSTILMKSPRSFMNRSPWPKLTAPIMSMRRMSKKLFAKENTGPTRLKKRSRR